jgi:phosphatidylinositol alpha-1,6-mannosyltransferase
VILFLHGIEAWPRQDVLTRRLLQNVHLILSNSDYTWARFVACNPEVANTQHQTVHLGAGESLQGATPCPSPSPVVLMVGRLNKDENYKGHRQMIEAWPLVLKRVPSAELWIVGDGSLRPHLEEIAREGAAGGSVRFYGQVPDAEKDRLIAQSRCLALPSRGEGFGLVYLEAMRQGRPCLVSNLDAGREVVNPPEAGLEVDPTDPQGILAAVERLLTPGSEWDNWSARARARYENNFTSAQFQQRFLSAVFET